MNFKKADLSAFDILPNPNPDGNGIVAKYKTSDNDLVFLYEVSPRVDFDEYDNTEPEPAHIRIMPWGDGARVQFRASQVPMKNGSKGKGKEKKFAAIGYLSLYDLELIVKHIKSRK